MSAPSIALNRFGLGARAGAAAPADPKKYLIAQLASYRAETPAMAALPTRTTIIETFQQYRMDKKEEKANGQAPAKANGQKGQKRRAMAAGEAPPETMSSDKMSPNDAPAPQMAEEVTRKFVREFYVGAAQARLQNALLSESDFPERLVHFWSNHFAVSIDKLPVLALAGDYEFHAIRPNIMGKFSDLLFAAVRHPAMLLYLDQAGSVGPNSQLAKFVANRPKGKRELGLNENLAREIMELHTLGVRTGYSQADVTEFARALTGTSVAGLNNAIPKRLFDANATPGETIFADIMHEPGSRTIMGESYVQQGQAQSAAILADLSVHPSTAKHIATKLARHFVADDPPPALVARLEANFLKTGGDLPSLYRELVNSPEAWADSSTKFKSPWEWTVSALRAVGSQGLPGNTPAANLFNQIGQPIWQPKSPAGYADTAAEWAGGNALIRRVELADLIATRVGERIDARALGPQILPGSLTPTTAESIARAESPAQGLALLLVSPEFLRR